AKRVSTRRERSPFVRFSLDRAGRSRDNPLSPLRDVIYTLFLPRRCAMWFPGPGNLVLTWDPQAPFARLPGVYLLAERVFTHGEDANDPGVVAYYVGYVGKAVNLSNRVNASPHIFRDLGVFVETVYMKRWWIFCFPFPAATRVTIEYVENAFITI